MSSSEVEEFLKGPLVTWFISCLKDSNSLATYNDLLDGVLLHSVFLQINPESFHNEVTSPNGDSTLRIKNLEFILKNVRQFYEENLGHLLVKLPDITSLGKEPESHVEDMQLLLLLILGCAVQCKEKEKFVMDIKNLDVNTQLAIVEYIKQITDYQQIVITQDFLEIPDKGSLYTQMKYLIEERNFYCEKWKSLELRELEILNNSMIISQSEDPNKSKFNSSMKFENEEDRHSPEIAHLKFKIRKLRQELEEKSETLMEYKGEIEHITMILSNLRQENEKLIMEARTAKSYRDELDAAVERAEKADRLEMEISRYRNKLNSIEFYKSRIEELQEDNKVLLETRETLEEELSSQRKRAEKVPELEAEIGQTKRLLSDMTLERTADRENYQQLREEYIHLQCLIKSMNEASIVEHVSDSEEPEIVNNSLSDQLTSSAQTRVLKLELENRRLLTVVESLKENSSPENSSQIVELQNEKEELSGKFDSLTRKYERLVQRNSKLEFTYKLAKQENKQLQASVEKQKEEIADQVTLESQHEQLSKDYVNRLQEREILKTNLKDVKNELRVLRDSYEKLEIKNNSLQNERETLEKEMKSLKVLKKEHSKLKEDFRNLYTKARILTVQNKNLDQKNNGDINKLKLKLTEVQGELYAREERCSNLTFQISNLNQRCEELIQINTHLEKDRQNLMEYTHALSIQNKDLFNQIMEEKDHFYAEDKSFSDTINQMNCHKRKLEEKIMDLHQKIPTSTSNINKGTGLGTDIMRKIKKAGSNMLRKTRRSSCSWEDDLKQSEEKRCEFEFRNNTFESNKTMTLDPRLLRKRGPHDRFSLGNLEREKLNYFSEDSVTFTSPSTLEKSFCEILHQSEDKTLHKSESKATIGQLNNSVFEVINEIEDVNSIQDENQKDKEPENNLKYSSRAGSRRSLWQEYGCA